MKASIHGDAITLQDKMNSSHLRSICNFELSIWIFEYAKSFKSNQKTDLDNLALFLYVLSDYLSAFGSKSGLTCYQRFQKIIFATNFLCGKNTALKVTGMTRNALDGLTMNMNSFEDIMKNSDLREKVRWDKFSSFCVERIFSVVRSRNSSPSSYELGRDIKQISAESMRRSRSGVIGFAFPNRKVTYSSETNSNQPSIRVKSTLVYSNAKRSKTLKKLTDQEKKDVRNGLEKVSKLKNIYKERQLNLRANLKRPTCTKGTIKKLI